jgi:hypothetical protein
MLAASCACWSAHSLFANSEYVGRMALKPLDILVALKLQGVGAQPLTYAQLANSLELSVAEAHAACKRLIQARLAEVNVEGRSVPSMKTKALEEFIVFGLKYVFYPERGEMTRGMPTAHAALPLKRLLVPNDEPVPVWPDAEGTVRGYSFEPLYRTVPSVARHDPALYELLALIDAVRDGRARERELARVALHCLSAPWRQ